MKQRGPKDIIRFLPFELRKHYWESPLDICAFTIGEVEVGPPDFFETALIITFSDSTIHCWKKDDEKWIPK